MNQIPISARSGRLLIAIVLLGGMLRFYGLSVQSLWNDELLIWDVTSRNSSVASLITQGVHLGSIHPPGYILIMYGVTGWFGTSEAALRAPSAVAGTLAILAIFFLGRRLYSETEGVIAAALMAVLWAPIYYSQEARSYSLLILFSILTMHAWIVVLEALELHGRGVRPWRARRDLWPVLGYVAAALVCAYLHYFGLYLVALQGAGALLWFLRRPRVVPAILAMYAPIVAAYLPWVPAMLHDASAFERGFDNIQQPGPRFFLSLPLFFFNRSRALLPIVVALYATFLFRHAADLYRKQSDARSTAIPFGSADRLVVLWLVVPFTVIFIESVLYRPLANERNLLIILPAAYLLAARALAELRLPRISPYRVAGAFVAVFLLHLLVVKAYYRRPTKQQFREAIQYVVERAPSYPGSVVATTGGRNRYLNYYLIQFGFADRAESLNNDHAVWQLLATDGVRFIWFVHSPGLGHVDPDLLSHNGLKVVERKQFHKMIVRLFAVPAAPEA